MDVQIEIDAPPYDRELLVKVLLYSKTGEEIYLLDNNGKKELFCATSEEFGHKAKGEAAGIVQAQAGIALAPGITWIGSHSQARNGDEQTYIGTLLACRAKHDPAEMKPGVVAVPLAQALAEFAQPDGDGLCGKVLKAIGTQMRVLHNNG